MPWWAGFLVRCSSKTGGSSLPKMEAVGFMDFIDLSHSERILPNSSY